MKLNFSKTYSSLFHILDTVDDILIAHIKNFDIKMFYNEISNLHPSLIFTSKEETDWSLPFLDVLLRRMSNSLQMSIYRKHPLAFCLSEIKNSKFDFVPLKNVLKLQ